MSLASYLTLMISWFWVKKGKSVVGLGNKGTNTICDYGGFKVKLHSLGSVNFLKIEPSNHIFISN